MPKASALNPCTKALKLAERDRCMGETVVSGARAKLESRFPDRIANTIQAASEAERARLAYRNEDERSLVALVEQPFHAMVDIDFEYDDGREKHFVLYANKNINVPQSFRLPDGRTLNVLSWTHPAVIRGLSAKLDSCTTLDANRYGIGAITTYERAVFDGVLPEILALYEPGGRVPPSIPPKAQVTQSKKAIKTGMTADQGRAFVATARGVMILTGAPGSGKTTVALQRSRYLINEGNDPDSETPFYTPRGTRIFLPNRNLIQQSAELIRSELQLPDDAVIHVEDYVARLVDRLWSVKLGARPRQRRLDPLRTKALQAFFGLCQPSYLTKCWQTLESQAAEVLAEAETQEWAAWSDKTSAFARALKRTATLLGSRPRAEDPSISPVTLDALYREAGPEYEAARAGLPGQQRDAFDSAVSGFLFTAFDPLTCIRSWFLCRRAEGSLRIDDGTAGEADAAVVMNELGQELADRVYGPEALPWIAWLLRFVVPSENQATKRFRAIAGSADDYVVELGPWSHVIIDEGQDLSVAEASLLASRVHPKGALTVAADYRQVVSPVRGITDGRAFKVGCPIRDRVEDKNFLLTQNKRQSASIAVFLVEAYREIFSEPAPFIPDDQDNPGPLPRLAIQRETEFPGYIRQLMNVFGRSATVGSVALLQVNENEATLVRLRTELERLGVPLVPIWDASGRNGGRFGIRVESGHKPKPG
jgi:hypothetical protein